MRVDHTLLKLAIAGSSLTLGVMAIPAPQAVAASVSGSPVSSIIASSSTSASSVTAISSAAATSTTAADSSSSIASSTISTQTTATSSATATTSTGSASISTSSGSASASTSASASASSSVSAVGPQFTGVCADKMCGGADETFWATSDWSNVMAWFNYTVATVDSLKTNIGADSAVSFTKAWGDYIGVACGRPGWAMTACSITDATSCSPGTTYVDVSRDCIFSWRVGTAILNLNVFYATYYATMENGFNKINQAGPGLYDALNSAYPSSDGMNLKGKLTGLKSLLSGASAWVKGKWITARLDLQSGSPMTSDAIDQANSWISQLGKAKSLLSKASTAITGLSIAVAILTPAEPDMIVGTGQNTAIYNYWQSAEKAIDDKYESLMKDEPYGSGLWDELGSGRWILAPENSPSQNILNTAYMELVTARYLNILWKRYGIWFQWDSNSTPCEDNQDYLSSTFCWQTAQDEWQNVRMVNYGGGTAAALNTWRYVKAWQFDGALSDIGSRFNLQYVFSKSLECHNWMYTQSGSFGDTTNPNNIPLPWAMPWDMYSYMMGNPAAVNATQWLQDNIYREPDISDWDGTDTHNIMCLFSVPVVPTDGLIGPRDLNNDGGFKKRSGSGSELGVSNSTIDSRATHQNGWAFAGQVQMEYADQVIKQLVDPSFGSWDGPYCGDPDQYGNAMWISGYPGTPNVQADDDCGKFYNSPDFSFGW